MSTEWWRRYKRIAAQEPLRTLGQTFLVLAVTISVLSALPSIAYTLWHFRSVVGIIAVIALTLVVIARVRHNPRA